MDYHCKYCGTKYNSQSVYNRHSNTKIHKRIVKQFDKMLRSKNNEINKLRKKNKHMNKICNDMDKDIYTILQICDRAQYILDTLKNIEKNENKVKELKNYKKSTLKQLCKERGLKKYSRLRKQN